MNEPQYAFPMDTIVQIIEHTEVRPDGVLIHKHIDGAGNRFAGRPVRLVDTGGKGDPADFTAVFPDLGLSLRHWDILYCRVSLARPIGRPMLVNPSAPLDIDSWIDSGLLNADPTQHRHDIEVAELRVDMAIQAETERLGREELEAQRLREERAAKRERDLAMRAANQRMREDDAVGVFLRHIPLDRALPALVRVLRRRKVDVDAQLAELAAQPTQSPTPVREDPRVLEAAQRAAQRVSEPLAPVDPTQPAFGSAVAASRKQVTA